jgi:ribulose-phosphate 3-epimerase
MSRIIPTILVRTEADFRRQVAAVAHLAPMIQIDVLDGTLYPQTTFHDAAAIAKMHLAVPFEVHLMVNRPEEAAKDWIKAGATRLIVHIEAEGNVGLALQRVKLADRIPGLAINPETDLAALAEFAPFIQHVLVMGVHPGRQGQSFDPDTVDRVRAIKRAYPRLTVGVDGGVTDWNHIARSLAASGADDLCVGSALWTARDPAAAYRQIAADAKI